MNNTIVIETADSMRTLAREALRGNWKLAVLATLVYMVATTAPMEILIALFGDSGALMSSVYMLLVTGPFTIGFSMFCMNLFRRKDAQPAQVFYGFEQFGKAIGLTVVMGLLVFLWTLLFIVPGIIAAYRYSQAFFVMVDHPEYGIMDCIGESKRIMMGNKAKFFCLELSFIGWALLCEIPSNMAIWNMSGDGVFDSLLAYVASIGYLWLLPYMTIASVGFYEIATGSLRAGTIITGAREVPDDRMEATRYVETAMKDEDVNGGKSDSEAENGETAKPIDQGGSDTASETNSESGGSK